MQITMEDLAHYYDQLVNHDWFFEYSDDGNVWQHGYNEHAKLQGMTTQNSLYAQIYRDVADWIYRRAPKPPRPTE